MEEIPSGYAMPTSLVVGQGKIQDQDVVVLDLEVIVPDENQLEPQRAVLVFVPTDAAKVAALISEAIVVGEEVK